MIDIILHLSYRIVNHQQWNDKKIVQINCRLQVFKKSNYVTNRTRRNILKFLRA